MRFSFLILAASLFFPATVHAAQKETAVFAGGCFWCMESEYQGLKGVSDVTSGYAGPERATPPTYKEVSQGDSGYLEAVSVTYDPKIVSYERLLEIFWGNVDPFDEKGQFCDKGTQYTAAIFYASKQEQDLANASLLKVEKKYGQKVATKIIPHDAFYPAEEHHQDYFEKNALAYKLYRSGCRRDARLEDLEKSAK